MRGQVIIGDKTVDMLANGASPFLYKRIFKRDFLVAAGDPNNINMDVITEMGFVMHMQTQKTFKDILDTVTVEDFYNWVSQFEALELPMSADQIFRLYHNQEAPTSTPKKKR